MLVIVQLYYDRTNIKSHMVYRCSFSNVHQSSSHSSFIPGWLVLLFQVKIQHPQTSVNGILFMWHPLLRMHFIRYSTASGAGGFKHRTGEKLPEPWLLVCASNMQVQWTRRWWQVFSFGCTIWVEQPAKLIYFCVDLWLIQHTYRWGHKWTISIPSIVVVDGTAVINSVTKTDQMKTYQDFGDCFLAIICNIAENYDQVRLVFDRHMKHHLRNR